MSQLKPVEILLVEDNPHDAELTQRALKNHRLANNVVHVSDGEQALDYLFGRGIYAHNPPPAAPRVILLDLKLPKVDGLEVLRTIRQDPRTQFIPTVVMTSSNQERDVIESYRLGVNSFIVKPVDSDQFLEVVRNLGLYWVLMNHPPPA